MWHSMFVVQIPVLEKILRTVLVYATILILFRLTGKRDLATFNMFDFVVMFLLSNVVQNAIIGSDSSLSGGMIGAVTLVAVNAVLNRLITASDRAARILEGKANGRYRKRPASFPARRGACPCGPPMWNTPSGCRTATTSRRSPPA